MSINADWYLQYVRHAAFYIIPSCLVVAFAFDDKIMELRIFQIGKLVSLDSIFQ